MSDDTKPTPIELLRAISPGVAKTYLAHRAAIREKRRFTLNRFVSLAIAFVLAGTGSFASQSFDHKVSEARRHMRAACRAVQKIVGADAAERPGIKEVATEDVAQAEKLWTSLAREYSAMIPEGYAGDPSWSQRLEDVRLDLSRMRKEIAAGEWRPAFLSCAHACNWITTMHEANGVILAIDTMAALRKKVGFARGFLTAEKPDKARALLKEILAARDAVLLAPPPVTSSRDAYLEALPELSQATDALAAAGRGEFGMKTPLDKLAAVVERVYELAI